MNATLTGLPIRPPETGPGARRIGPRPQARPGDIAKEAQKKTKQKGKAHG